MNKTPAQGRNKVNVSKNIPGRDARGRLLPGHTANPGGRPRGLSRYVRELTRDGRTLAEFFHRIFRGEDVDGQTPSFQDRLKAAEWLADRGFGRPTQPLSGDEDRPPLQMSRPELLALIQYVTAGDRAPVSAAETGREPGPGPGEVTTE